MKTVFITGASSGIGKGHAYRRGLFGGVRTKGGNGSSTPGAPVYTTVRFGSVKPASFDTDIFTISVALANLQKPLLNGFALQHITRAEGLKPL